MNLQVDNNVDISSQLPLDQLTFSPVLTWKPSTRPTQPTQAAKHNVVHTQSPAPPPTQQQPMSDATDVPLKASISSNNKLKERKEGGGRKSPLLTVKTTDLTQVLPSDVSEEKKVHVLYLLAYSCCKSVDVSEHIMYI